MKKMKTHYAIGDELLNSYTRALISQLSKFPRVDSDVRGKLRDFVTNRDMLIPSFVRCVCDEYVVDGLLAVFD